LHEEQTVPGMALVDASFLTTLVDLARNKAEAGEADQGEGK